MYVSGTKSSILVYRDLLSIFIKKNFSQPNCEKLTLLADSTVHLFSFIRIHIMGFFDAVKKNHINPY